MRKKLTILLVMCMILSLFAGCGKGASDAADHATQEIPPLSALTFDNGTAVVRFTKDETNKWIWADDTTFPLDDTVLLAAIDSLDTMESVTITEEQLGEYGLSSPEKYFALTHGEETSYYYVGSAVEDSFYCTPGEELTTACRVPDAMVTLMKSSIYDLARLPQLPQLTADQIVHVDIAYKNTTLTLTPSNGRWLSQGSDVTEQAAPLQEALTHLSLTRCVDYAPTSGVDAICGLTDKAVVVTVQYATSMGGSGKLVLTVGGTYGDGYFARIGEDSTVYQLPQAIGAPIRNLAENGI